jgi:hypothetical protein
VAHEFFTVPLKCPIIPGKNRSPTVTEAHNPWPLGGARSRLWTKRPGSREKHDLGKGYMNMVRVPSMWLILLLNNNKIIIERGKIQSCCKNRMFSPKSLLESAAPGVNVVANG